MHLLINTATTFKGGSLQMARSFIMECKKFSENRFTVVLGKEISALIETEEFPDNFRFYTIPYRPAKRVLSLKNPSEFLQKIEDDTNPDVVFTTSGPAYWRPKAPHLIGYNLPHYIYPDSPFFKKLPLKSRLFWNLKGKLIRYYYKRDGNYFVVQTDDVNRRLRKWLNTDAVETVSNTFSSQYEHPVSEPLSFLLPSADGNFRFLVFSSYYAHKNFEILNPLAKLAKENSIEDLRFILTLPEADYHRVIFPENREIIQNIGVISPEKGPQLYRECDTYFQPSLLECFSAGYAEAMQMEKPILTSDLSFARTVCKEAALYFNPLDAGDAFKKLLQIKEDENLRNRLVEEGKRVKGKLNNAAERAEEYLEICKRLMLQGI